MLLLLVMLGCRGLTVNDVTTGESPDYPELRSLYVDASLSQASSRAKAISEQMPGWTCATERPFQLRCEVAGDFGTDDVWVTVSEHGPKMSKVQLRSASRGDMGDFGRNAERIQQWQAAFLDPTR